MARSFKKGTQSTGEFVYHGAKRQRGFKKQPRPKRKAFLAVVVVVPNKKRIKA